VFHRIWQLNGRPELRHIIGQGTSSFQMADVVSQGKVLLVNLGGLAQETASLTGTLIMNALWHAVKTSPAENRSTSTWTSSRSSYGYPSTRRACWRRREVSGLV
jgi:hypothetical protein